MPVRLGIGIATYNRRDVLAQTLDHVAHYTKCPFMLAVADDGSTDGTLELLRSRNVTTVTGRNMGIAWNKNRVLYLLAELLRCDIMLLLEDDTAPAEENWELDWVGAALLWGHANLAGDWMSEHFLSGTGTVDDPVLSSAVTAQCAVFSREALLFGGYFDSRFKGYGHEHVEHSYRLMRGGYGGREETLPDGTRRTIYPLLRSALQFSTVPASFHNEDQVARNLAVARMAMFEENYRNPWRDETEMRQFREELRAVRPRVL